MTSRARMRLLVRGSRSRSLFWPRSLLIALLLAVVPAAMPTEDPMMHNAANSSWRRDSYVNLPKAGGVSSQGWTGRALPQGGGLGLFCEAGEEGVRVYEALVPVPARSQGGAPVLDLFITNHQNIGELLH